MKKFRQMKRMRSSSSDKETDNSTEVSCVAESTLEVEEETMEDFADKIDSVWDLILSKFQESPLYQQQEEALNSMCRDIDALKQENTYLKTRLYQAEGRLTRTEKKLDEANERIVDLTSRSMRNNLIFKNIDETKGENIEAKLRSVFKDKLKLSDPDKIEIERAHRVGKPIAGKTRNIIAALSSKGKYIVMSHLKNLARDDTLKIH